MATLTQDELKSLLMYDPATGVFTWRVTRSRKVVEGSVAGSVNNEGYCHIKFCNVNYKAHRLAWLYMYGVWPPNCIDHINRVRNDNRIENLRLATKTQNGQNRSLSKTNISGVTGVTWYKKSQRWRAQICVDGQHLYLGTYDTVEDAANARYRAEDKFHHYKVEHAVPTI
jgi:hypothetical protein